MKYDIYLNETLVGYLYVDKKNGELFSFQYEREYLDSVNFINIDPNLRIGASRQFPIGKAMFGFLEDMTPDRWGKTLLKRKLGQAITESDFLTGVNDVLRMGAIRIFESGLPLAENNGVPTVKNLSELQGLTGKVGDFNADLRGLFDPGSPLGGARPKAGIIKGNELYIAKFPKSDDELNVEGWEQTYLDLFNRCDFAIKSMNSELKKVGDLKHPLLIMKRFDRSGNIRIPYLSAMTALNYKDGSGGGSYLELSEFIMSNGIKSDSLELWKRMMFNILLNNRDDHLRNHGFLYEDGVWRLSPVFDINPTIDKSYHELSTDGSSHAPDLDYALELSEYFGFEDLCMSIDWLNKSIATLQSHFRATAKRNGIKESEIEMVYSHLVLSSVQPNFSNKPSGLGG